MENFNLAQFLLNHLDLLISAGSALAFFVVNIILAIKNKDKKRLQEALAYVPEVIRIVEYAGSVCNYDSLTKKATAEVLLREKFGKLYTKNYQLFEDAIEDILNTPQKKGGSSDVSKESQSQER